MQTGPQTQPNQLRLRLRYGEAPGATPNGDGPEADVRRALERRAAQVLVRLEDAANKGRGAGRPFVVEFAGSPRAGKTTLLRRLEVFLKRNGYSVGVVDEAMTGGWAGDKRDFTCNARTVCRTVERVLELSESTRNIVLLDRGLFDRLCWLRWYRETGLLSTNEYDAISRFVRLPRWRELVDVVFVLTARPAVALQRDLTNQLTWKPGQIVNEVTLTQLNQAITAMSKAHHHDMRCIPIDTSAHDELQTLAWITKIVLKGLDRFAEYGIADGVENETPMLSSRRPVLNAR